MKRMRVRVSTWRSCAATLALLPASFFAGCGGGSLPVVLRESEALRHLPRGTRILAPDSPAGTPAFEVTAPEGAWLVSAAYLSRIHELLGRDANDAPGSRIPSR